MKTDKCHWCNHSYALDSQSLLGYCSRKCFQEDPNSVAVQEQLTAQFMENLRKEHVANVVGGLVAVFMVIAFFMALR